MEDTREQLLADVAQAEAAEANALAMAETCNRRGMPEVCGDDFRARAARHAAWRKVAEARLAKVDAAAKAGWASSVLPGEEW